MSPYVCDADPSEPVEVASAGSELELSPQSTCTFHGLSGPGSLNEPRSKLFDEPSSEDWSLGAVTVGGTFFTVTDVV